MLQQRAGKAGIVEVVLFGKKQRRKGMKANFLNDLWHETIEFLLIAIILILGCLIWHNIRQSERIDKLEYLEAKMVDLEMQVRWGRDNHLKREGKALKRR